MSDSHTHSVPSWIWLFTGVATGLFLAFLYYLAGIQTPLAEVTDKSTATRQEKPSASAPKFDFYNLLPKVEVNSSASKHKTNPTAQATQTPPTTQQSNQANLNAVLQTGAFTVPKDADRRRAELLLLGLDVNIETAEVKGQTFHRVQVGPFNSNQTLSQAKDMLKQNGIEHIQLKN